MRSNEPNGPQRTEDIALPRLQGFFTDSTPFWRRTCLVEHRHVRNGKIMIFLRCVCVCDLKGSIASCNLALFIYYDCSHICKSFFKQPFLCRLVFRVGSAFNCNNIYYVIFFILSFWLVVLLDPLSKLNDCWEWIRSHRGFESSLCEKKLNTYIMSCIFLRSSHIKKIFHTLLFIYS